MNIEMVLAARTILYLPIYVMERRIRSFGHTLHVVYANGDHDAYRRLHFAADFCVCDPIIVAEEISSSPKTLQSHGVVIASLVQKTGLWLITTDSFTQMAPGSTPLVQHLINSAGTFSTILSYTSESTGGRVLQHFLNDIPSLRTVARMQCQLGDELNYISTRLKDATPHALRIKNAPVRPQRSDVVLTCDALAASILTTRHFDSTSTSKGHPSSGPLYQRPPYDSVLFTALVVNKNFLRDNKGVVTDVLECLQDILQTFHSSDDKTREELAHFLALDKRIPRSVGPESEKLLIHCETSELLNQAREVVKALKTDEVIARTIVINRAQWKQAYLNWDLPQKVEAKCFKRCCRKDLARSVFRWSLLFAIRRKLRRELHHLRRVYDLLAAFGFTAVLWRLPFFPSGWQKNELLFAVATFLFFAIVSLLRWLRIV